jgi:hypothetical protein
MTLSGYEVVGPDATWHPGDGTPRLGEILRTRAAPSPAR